MSRRRAPTLLCATAIAAVWAAPAAAQPAQVVTAMDGERAGLEHVVLVGESGQLYVPGDDGWRREHAGGIAGDVTGAARGSDGARYVIGGRAPVYELVDRAWRLHSLGVQRRSRASTLTGYPIVAKGRQLYTLEGDSWKRIGSAPTPRVDAIWAGGPRHVYLTDDNGEIRRRDGGSWTTVTPGFAPPEQIAQLIGIPRRALFAIGDAGTLHRVGASRTTAVAIPEELAGFRPTAAGSDDKKAVYFAGPAPDGEGGERQLLVSIGAKGPLALVDELPPLGDGDRYSLIVARPGGALLVASYAGRVRLRATDGSWTEHTVTTALPEQQPTATRAKRKPARTQ